MRAYSSRSYSRMATVVLLPILLAHPGCGSSSGPQKTAEDFAEDGWVKFASENYSAALDDFLEATSMDSEYADGYLGAGWASLYLKRPQDALSHFSIGLSKASDSSTLADLYAGDALTNLELEQYSLCISGVNACFAIVPSYVFPRQPSVNRIDLKVAQANAYFQLGGDSNLAKAADLVHEADVRIALDPETPESWRVDGTTYGTFSEALLRALEQVSEMAASS